MIPEKTPEMGSVGKDTTINQPNTMLPDTTNSNSVLPDETDTKDDNTVVAERNDEKPSRGMFKTKTITIHRSKDSHTFKCSVCGTQTPTLHE